MPKPYVICHMLQSIDGRIDGSFFGVPTTAELSVYYQKKVSPTRQTQCSMAEQRLSGSLQVIHRFN